MLGTDETLLSSLVDKVQVEINKVPVAKAEEVSRKLDIDVDELAAWQQCKNIAMMEGRISQDVAQQLYAYMGESPTTFNNQPLAIKVVVTKMMAELLKGSLSRS